MDENYYDGRRGRAFYDTIDENNVGKFGVSFPSRFQSNIYIYRTWLLNAHWFGNQKQRTQYLQHHARGVVLFDTNNTDSEGRAVCHGYITWVIMYVITNHGQLEYIFRLWSALSQIFSRLALFLITPAN